MNGRATLRVPVELEYLRDLRMIQIRVRGILPLETFRSNEVALLVKSEFLYLITNSHLKGKLKDLVSLLEIKAVD